jgi:hypothetical protein
VTLLGPETRLRVLSLPAEQLPSSANENDEIKLVEDFDEKDW